MFTFVQVRAVGAALLVSCACAGVLGATPAPFLGEVVAVHDGDTVTVATADNRRIVVRLADIDAPELAQQHGQSSRDSLTVLCRGQQATVQPSTTDRYGRMVGRLTCGGVDASHAQIATGQAWAFRKYLTRVSLLEVEGRAKAAGYGLWAEKNPQAPWDWRQSRSIDPVPVTMAAKPLRRLPLAERLTPARSAPPLNLDRFFAHHEPEPWMRGDGGAAVGLSGSNSHDIQTGPRGGQFYVNDAGNKTYVPRAGRGR